MVPLECIERWDSFGDGFNDAFDQLGRVIPVEARIGDLAGLRRWRSKARISEY
jgi:hypothetical protein